jgi:hypothetical protein
MRAVLINRSIGSMHVFEVERERTCSFVFRSCMHAALLRPGRASESVSLNSFQPGCVHRRTTRAKEGTRSIERMCGRVAYVRACLPHIRDRSILQKWPACTHATKGATKKRSTRLGPRSRYASLRSPPAPRVFSSCSTGAPTSGYSTRSRAASRSSLH